MQPNYKNIYADIILEKFPHKISECRILLEKTILSAIDIISLNEKIYGGTARQQQQNNQKFKSYSKRDILEILDYQKMQQLNNSELAIHFKLSRNTIAKWKKNIFID